MTTRPPRRMSDLATVPDPVRVYLREVGKVALLDAMQEVDLAKRIEAGVFAAERLRCAADAGEVLGFQMNRDLRLIVSDGGRARNHLLEANLRLVVSLAKRYTGRGLAFLDLVQEGNLGLIRAVEKFDYAQGYKFSTYATWWIRQALGRALADQSRTIRIPVHVGELITRLGRARRSLLQELGREATQAELAVAMDVTVEKVIELQRYGREPVSLDEPIGDEGDTRFGDLVEDTWAGRRVRRAGRHVPSGGVAERAGDPVRPGGGGHPAAVRAHRRAAPHAGRDRPGLRGHPRADSSDRGEDDDQAPPPRPLPVTAQLRRLTHWSAV